MQSVRGLCLGSRGRATREKDSGLPVVHATVWSEFTMKNVKPNLAYEFIRKRILNGEYPPGHPLLTEPLSAAIGVSRTPVSEALLKLQADGLVTMRPRLGACVKVLEFAEFCEICEMRLALEAHAAGKAATRRTDGELREIQLALEAMHELGERIIATEDETAAAEDMIRLNVEDIRFHIGIMAAAKNNLMRKEILRLHLINRVVAGPFMIKWPQVTKAEADANHRVVMASHQEIFDAIAQRDSKAARAAMERHIDDIINKTVALVRPAADAAARDLTPEELAYIG